MLDAIRAEINRRSYTQRKLTSILDDHQPAISNLLQEKINQASIEKLLGYSDSLGMRTRLKVLPALEEVSTA